MSNRIRVCRKMRGLSQSDLAKLLNTTGASISRYESDDDRITLPLMRRIAAVLNVAVVDLLSAEDAGAQMEGYWWAKVDGQVVVVEARDGKFWRAGNPEPITVGRLGPPCDFPEVNDERA